MADVRLVVDVINRRRDVEFVVHPVRGRDRSQFFDRFLYYAVL
jgi:hypothetical protein